MADSTITALTAGAALSGTELFEMVQSGSKKATAAQIKTFAQKFGFTAGSVFFSDSAGVPAQDNTNLFWDNTGKILSVANLAITILSGTVVTLGNHTSTATATPLNIDMGGTFSSVSGANPKLSIFSDGANVAGLGISSGQFDYITSSGSHTFYIGGTKYAALSSTLLTLATSMILVPPASAAALATNGQLTFEATSNTSMTFKYRGSDGTTRSASLTLS